jgi:amino acid transporter
MLFVLIGALTLLNAIGVRNVMRWLSALTILKFLPLIALVGVGLLKVDLSTSWPSQADKHDLGAAVLIVFYVYSGFESGQVAAGEARNPQRDIPVALLVALAVCSVLYVLIQAISVATLPDLASSTRPLTDVAAVLMGSFGALLLTAGIVASVGGNLVGAMFSIPRITYRLALDGSLPRWFGTVDSRHNTPVWSIVFFGMLGFLLAASGGFVWLAGLSVVTRLMVYLLCIGAVLRLQKRFGNIAGVLKRAGGYTAAAFAAVVALGLLTQVKASAFASAFSLLAVGTVLYILARRSTRNSAVLNQ